MAQKNNDEFLPDDYTGIPGGGNYTKFIQGENKIRILSRPVIGWEYWVSEADGKRKPHRVKDFGDIPKEYAVLTGKEKPKYFWAVVIWNYNVQEVQILSITQKMILSALETLIEDEDWGSPLKYDLTIKKEGEGLNTEYQTNPKPKKDLDPEISQAFMNANIDLQVWFSGDDPFKGTTPSVEDVDVDEIPL